MARLQWCGATLASWNVFHTAEVERIMSKYVVVIKNGKAFIPNGTGQREVPIVRYPTKEDPESVQNHVLLEDPTGHKLWWKIATT